MGNFLQSMNSILNHKIEVFPKHHEQTLHDQPTQQIKNAMESDYHSINQPDQQEHKSVWAKLKHTLKGHEDHDEAEESIEIRGEVIPKSWYKNSTPNDELEIEIPLHGEKEGTSVTVNFFPVDEDIELTHKGKEPITSRPPEEKFEIKQPISKEVNEQKEDLFALESETPVNSVDSFQEEKSEEGVEHRFDKHGLSLDRHLSVLEDLEKKMLYSRTPVALKKSESEFETIHYYRNKKGSHLIRPK